MSQPFPLLSTPRLFLRQLAPDDDQQIFALRSNKEVNRYLDRPPAQSIEDAQAFIQKIIQGKGLKYWAITLHTENKLIGTACLFNISDDEKKGEIGYELLPAFQGKGIAQEAVEAVMEFAFIKMGLSYIEAYTRPDNLRSISMLEKFGFENTNKMVDNNCVFSLRSP